MRIARVKLMEQSDKQGFFPATDDFMDMFIISAKGYYIPEILNLEKINKRIGKTRKNGEYVKSHVINVRKQILNAPNIEVLEKLGTWCYRVKILPFDDVQKNDEKDEILNADKVVYEAENTCPEKDVDDLSEDSGIGQQQLIFTDQACKSVGINFQSRDLPKIAKYPLEAIRKAINHFKFAVEKNDIPSPTGWLISCLQHKWYLNFRPEKQVKSLVDKYFEYQDLLLDTLGTVPSRRDLPNNYFSKKTGLPARLS